MPDNGRMPYRYKVVFDVILEGDGQHADGNGARATVQRLRDAIKAEPRVIRTGTTGPAFIADRSRDNAR